MSKKEISIIIRAKNMVAAGLNSAGKALKSFGSGAMHLGRNIAIGLAAATAAVGAFAAKALSAYATQERAAKSLSAALTANGDDAATLVPKLEKVASAIQDETGAADEATIAGMAKMRMLGVQADKLEEAAKATLALTSIGMDEAAAQKAVALAMQGNYTLLQRYVPALKNAKDETEKARIVNELFARGYEQQKALLGTTSGAWAALKGRVGDVWEEFGKAIERSSGLTAILLRAGDAVKAFGQRVAEWIDSEKFKALQQSIQGILEAITGGAGGQGKEEVTTLALSFGDVLLAAIMDGANYMRQQIEAAMKGTALGKVTGAVKTGIARQARFLGGFFADGVSLKNGLAAIDQGEIDDAGETPKKLPSALEALAKQFDKMRQFAPPEKPKPPEKPIAQYVPTVEGMLEDVFGEQDEDARDERMKLAKKLKEDLLDLEEKETEAIKAEQVKRNEDAKESAQKQLEIFQELAKKKVKDYVAELKQERAEGARKADEDKKDDERDKNKAARLLQRQKAGGNIGQANQDWLDAFNAIAAAKKGVPVAKTAIQLAEDNLTKLGEIKGVLDQNRKDQKEIHAKLKSLLEMG